MLLEDSIVILIVDMGRMKSNHGRRHDICRAQEDYIQNNDERILRSSSAIH